MNRHSTQKKLVERLREPYGAEARPEPPKDLRAAILAEVPETLELSPELSSGGGAGGPVRRAPRWILAAAASLVVALGAGVIAVRVMEEHPADAPRVMTEEAVMDRAAEAPRQSRMDDAESAESARSDLRSLGYAGDSAARAPVPDPAPEAEPSAPGRQRLELFEEAQPAPPAAVEESIVVTTESPLLDERKVSRGVSIAQTELEKIPTARDPWDSATQTPGVLSDRIHVGGNESGQQSVFIAPGTSDDESSFAVDGEVVTDMSAIGSSPTYYDFDQFEEAQTAGRGAPKPRARKVSPPSPAALPPSTGGTAEPNDRPYGDVFFEAYPTNPFLDPEEDRLSTFALDVDTGSYTVVRRYSRDGHRPPPAAVRVEEMVNAFDYGDAPPDPRSGDDFALHAEGSRSPFVTGPTADRYHLLRFGLAARVVDDADRKPAVLTFVIDVSGSMAAENRLGLVKRSLGLLLDELRSDDRVGLVVYGSAGRVVLEPTPDKERIRRAIGSLRTEGATNAEEGLLLGYAMAGRHFREGAINRLILCSDGVANVGSTGPESILERVGAEARRGIELTTVGFGMGNYNDTLMEQLANRGDGAYAYVDRLDEAERVFVENLTGTLQTVARDAKVQVELMPGVVERYRLIGYENRDVPDEKFRDDTVDAGEVGAGHDVTALYELRLREGAAGNATVAILRLRYRSAESGEVVEVERPVKVSELRGPWEEAPTSLRLASVVAELAEILRGSYWAKDGDLDDLFRKAQKVASESEGDVRVSELATMIGRLAAMERAAGER